MSTVALFCVHQLVERNALLHKRVHNGVPLPLTCAGSSLGVLLGGVVLGRQHVQPSLAVDTRPVASLHRLAQSTLVGRFRQPLVLVQVPNTEELAFQVACNPLTDARCGLVGHCVELTGSIASRCDLL